MEFKAEGTEGSKTWRHGDVQGTPGRPVEWELREQVGLTQELRSDFGSTETDYNSNKIFL